MDQIEYLGHEYHVLFWRNKTWCSPERAMGHRIYQNKDILMNFRQPLLIHSSNFIILKLRNTIPFKGGRFRPISSCQSYFS